MMEYRKHPASGELIGTLGLGMGGIQAAPADEIEKTVRLAIEKGINFFDLCAGGASVYEPFGRAIADCRDKVYFQLHFGAVYNKNGEYGWSRKLSEIKSTFEWEMEKLCTSYVDFGFLHCVDEDDDLDALIENGIVDFVKELKQNGVVRHIGFSSHTPSVADRIIDMGIADMMMFSINPAYDLEKGDEYGIGTFGERAELFKKCEMKNIGISVMKPFHGGKLLSEKTSPFGKALTKNQCIQYVLDRPGVLCAVPGVRGMADLLELLPFIDSTREDNDYSVIGDFAPESASSSGSEFGSCVYCNHCQPCSAGIDIGIVNKYYDLSLVGDKMAHDHYSKLKIKADKCIGCGHCDKRCPFGVHQMAKMHSIAEYFGA